MAAAAVFAGPIRARPVVAGHEISRQRSSGGGAPPWLKPEWPENGSKRPNSGSTGFWAFSLGFWGWILTWHTKLGLYRA